MRKTKMMMNAGRQISLMAVLFLGIYISDASALTIVTRPIGGAAPVNTSGGGNLDEIMGTAARIWESAYLDPMILTIYYGWGQAGDAGTHTLQEIDSEGREISGLIIFDNSGSTPFYLDPTPGSNEEYRRRTEEYQDLGNGFINVARIFASPSGAAAGRIDLLSVALHELGHALGMSSANPRFREQSTHGVLTISQAYPFPGTMIPLAYNNSGIIAHFDVGEMVYGSIMGGINGDERRLPSQVDILANAQVSGFKIAVAATSGTEQTRRREPGTGTGVRGRAALRAGY